MIIAILEDRKKFRSSFATAYFLSRIRAPISALISAEIMVPSDKMPPPSTETISFVFDKWLEKNKVALYREEK